MKFYDKSDRFVNRNYLRLTSTENKKSWLNHNSSTYSKLIKPPFVSSFMVNLKISRCKYAIIRQKLMPCQPQLFAQNKLIRLQIVHFLVARRPVELNQSFSSMQLGLVLSYQSKPMITWAFLCQPQILYK